jgi:hypothetical protein
LVLDHDLLEAYEFAFGNGFTHERENISKNSLKVLEDCG